MTALLQPYVVELSSRENDQRRRVTVSAESRDQAAAIVEANENEYVDYQLDQDRLEQALEVAQFVPKDTDVDGRFIRAGKTIRTRGAVMLGGADQSAMGRVEQTDSGIGVRLTKGIGNTDTAALRAGLSVHHQEKPYRIERVGDPRISNVLAAMFGTQWQDQIEGGTNRFVWASDTFKVSLHTSTYTPNQDTHDFFDDATNQATGTGYTAGGVTLGTKTSEYDSASDQVRLKAANISWTTSTITARHAVIYVDTAGAASADPVFGYVNFESDVSTTAGTFAITWDATGIFVVDLT